MLLNIENMEKKTARSIEWLVNTYTEVQINVTSLKVSITVNP